MTVTVSSESVSVIDAAQRLRRYVVGLSVRVDPVADPYVVEVVAREVAQQVLPNDARVEYTLHTEALLSRALYEGHLSEWEKAELWDLFPSDGPFAGCVACNHRCKVRPFVRHIRSYVIEAITPYLSTPQFERVGTLAYSAAVSNVFGDKEQGLEAVLICCAAITAGESLEQAAVLIGARIPDATPAGLQVDVSDSEPMSGMVERRESATEAGAPQASAAYQFPEEAASLSLRVARGAPAPKDEPPQEDPRASSARRESPNRTSAARSLLQHHPESGASMGFSWSHAFWLSVGLVLGLTGGIVLWP